MLPKPIVLFDVDDVIVDWRGAARAVYGPKVDEISGSFARDVIHPEHSAMWEEIKSHPTFWLDLSFTDWGLRLIDFVEGWGLDWYFCTAHSRNDPRSASHKVEWCNKHGWDGHEKLVITAQKWLCAAPHKILIDDKDSNVEEFSRHGGNGILLPQAWNKAANQEYCRWNYVTSRIIQHAREYSQS